MATPLDEELTTPKISPQPSTNPHRSARRRRPAPESSSVGNTTRQAPAPHRWLGPRSAGSSLGTAVVTTPIGGSDNSRGELESEEAALVGAPAPRMSSKDWIPVVSFLTSKSRTLPTTSVARGGEERVGPGPGPGPGPGLDPGLRGSEMVSPWKPEVAAPVVVEVKESNSSGSTRCTSTILASRSPRAAAAPAKQGKVSQKPGTVEDTPKTPPPAVRPALPSYQARRRIRPQQEQPGGGGTTTAAATRIVPGPGERSIADSVAGRQAEGDEPAQGTRRDSSEGSLRRGRGPTSIAKLKPGMPLLCLDIFISAVGGDEIRRWRPAEITEIIAGGGPEDQMLARVTFSSHADEKKSVYLRLRDDWNRLAPALSLTEEEMNGGAPLSGRVLAASQNQFKPRSNHRRGSKTRAGPAGSKPRVAATADTARGAVMTGSGGVEQGDKISGDSGESGASIEGSSRRRRDESCKRSKRDGGGGGSSGGRDVAGGGDQNPNVAKIAAALKMAIAIRQDGDTSKSSGKGSNSMIHEDGSAAARPALKGAPPASSEHGDAGSAASLGAPLAQTSGPRHVQAATPSVGASGRETKAMPAAGFSGGEEIGAGSGGTCAPAQRPGSPKKKKANQEESAPGEGNGGAAEVRPAGGGDGKRERGGGGREKRTWRAWDMAKAPAIGDRFDCLDYFVSIQTQLPAKKWRDAEAMDVRHGQTGTEVFVHYLKWNCKWDRWISFSEEPERFSAYMARNKRAAETRAAALPGRARADQHSLFSVGETNSASSTATMTNTNSSVSSVGTLSTSGFNSGSGSSTARGSGDADGFMERSLSKAGAKIIAPNLKSDRLVPSAEGGGAGGKLHPPSSPSPPTVGSSKNDGSGESKRDSVAASAPKAGATARAGEGGASAAATACSPTGSGYSETSADLAFREAMRRNGLSVVDVEADGNCLFRSVSHQIYGDATRHFAVRKACVEHMTKYRARFGVFVTEDFRDYLYRIRQPGVWGDDLEIRALEELFDRPIEIYSAEGDDLRPMKIDFDASGLETGMAPIKLSYHGQSHYNSVRDRSLRYPLNPRRSKRILQMREAQHAHSPNSAVVETFSRAGGGKAGTRGSGAQKSCSRFAGLKESASFSVGGGSGRSGAKKRRSGGSGRLGAGGDSGSGGGGGAKSFAGVAIRTLFGGVSGRVST